MREGEQGRGALAQLAELRRQATRGAGTDGAYGGEVIATGRGDLAGADPGAPPRGARGPSPTTG
jgi:hypothetical protein